MASKNGGTRPLFRHATVVTVVVCFFVLGVVASAASLGGVNTSSVFSQQMDVQIDIPDPPGPLVSTNFSGCSNALDGWTDESGATWTSHSGNWQCLGNDVVRAQQRVDLGHATVNIDPINSGIRITTNFYDISSQNNRSGPGIALFGDGNGGLVYAIYERDNDQIIIGHRYSGGQSFSQFPFAGDLESGTMSVTVTGANLSLALDGQTIGSYVVPSYFLDKYRFGLVSDNDNQSRFDSFTIAGKK